MQDQEKLSRETILKQLNIADDTLSLYEKELEIDAEPGLETFTSEDIESIQMFHKLRESGLTLNEIRLLSSFSEVLKNVDFEGKDELKNLLSISPLHRLKQTLNISKQELNSLRSKAQELEELLKKEIESRVGKGIGNIAILEKELEERQKTINSLDRQLAETLTQKTQLESELALFKEGKGAATQIKGKKSKELYKSLVEKEAELIEAKRKTDELSTELEKSRGETLELSERLELMEDEIAEMEHEIEERYNEQLSTLRSQIEELMEKKQKEWETYYIQSNEQHKTELLTLQRKHEKEILRLKQKIKEQFEEMQELKSIKNPLLGIFKMGSR